VPLKLNSALGHMTKLVELHLQSYTDDVGFFFFNQDLVHRQNLGCQLCKFLRI